MGDAQQTLEQFGQVLRQRRRALDMTQEQLASCARCARATIQMIEQGRRRPSRQVAGLLAKCLHISEDESDSFVALARGTQAAPDTQLAQAHAPLSHAAEYERAEESSSTLGSTLPTQLTSLIGRHDEVRAIMDLLSQDKVRLLTLTGAPGIGKTRLLLQVASEATARTSTQFEDGIFWVPLASISDPDMVLQSIARVLDIQDAGTQPLLDSLKLPLGRKRLLLLLDNFEQVLEAAPAIADLLAACPGLKVLATSREALNVRGEYEFNVPPLEVPSDSAELGTRHSALGTVPSVALFVERAQAADRHFSLTPENSQVVASICSLLDGLPLAIELVAARTKLLPLSALLARLQDEHGQVQLSLLSGGARDLPDRHRTLRDAIGWSYGLLSPQEQLLFRRLGVFRGGFTLGAAEAICNAHSDLDLDVFEGVAQLLNKNLLTRETLPAEAGRKEGEGEIRFAMLETIREYALERLQEATPGRGAEAEKLRLLHAEYFLAIASAMDSVYIGESQRALLNRLDRDYDNLRAAMLWTIEHGHFHLASQFGISLARYWELRGSHAEGREWLLRILSMKPVAGEDAADPETRRALLMHAGRLSNYMNDYATSRALLEESLGISTRMGFKRGMSSAYMNLGNAARMQADYETARHFYEQCLHINEELGNRTNIANSLWMLGCVAADQGRFPQAEDLLNRSLLLSREMGDIIVTFGALRELGLALTYQGKYEWAIAILEECLDIAHYARFRTGVSWATAGLGFAVLGAGDLARAEGFFKQSIEMASKQDNNRLADSLEGLAAIELKAAALPGAANAETSLNRAATLLGAAGTIRRTLHTLIIPVRAVERDRIAADVSAHMDVREYERAYQAGQALSLEEAVSYAMSSSPRA